VPLVSGYFDWHEQPGYYRDVTRHFARDTKMLDVGCGSAWLAEHFSDYTGIDSSPDAMSAAARSGREIMLGTVDGPLPFDDATFGGVILKDVLEHVPEPVATVGEVQRVLRPGGRVFASSPDAQRWVWDDYTHRRPFSRRAFRLLFADSGFDVERVAFESVMPGTSIISRHTGRHQRPPILNALAWLPIVRRNVVIVARKPL
jgi:SAM-dependent methyltransferase